MFRLKLLKVDVNVNVNPAAARRARGPSGEDGRGPGPTEPASLSCLAKCRLKAERTALSCHYDPPRSGSRARFF